MRLMTTNFCTQAATVITANSANPNFPTSNLKHEFRSKRLRTADGTTDMHVVFDMQTTEDINSVVLLWPKEDGIKLSDTATIKIQANATNVWTAPAVDQALTIDNTYVLASHFFSTDQSYRYWRVVIEDDGNPYDYVELGVVWLGKGIDIENMQNGFKFTVADSSKTISTDYGHQYTDIYPTRTDIEFSFANMQYEQIETLENAFRSNGVRVPVLIVVDPLEIAFTANHLLVYGKFSQSLSLGHVNYNILNAEGLRVTETL